MERRGKDNLPGEYRGVWRLETLQIFLEKVRPTLKNLRHKLQILLLKSDNVGSCHLLICCVIEINIRR